MSARGRENGAAEGDAADESGLPPGVLWVGATSDRALDVMRSVERALVLVELGRADLLRGLTALGGAWSFDVDGLPERRPGVRGRLAHAFRVLVQRLLWWRHRDQLERILSFQGLANHTLQGFASSLADLEMKRRADVAHLEQRIGALEGRAETLAAQAGREKGRGE